MDTLLTLLAVALILLPGWALWLRLAAPQPSAEVAITGLAFSTAVAMVALYALSHVGLAAFVAAWLPALAWAAYQLKVQRPRFRVEAALAALALAAAAVRFLPALLQEFPPGWDPYFHLLVVRLIEQSGAHVASLSPFEEIRINYPTGTHLLTALIVKCTGASRYGVYQALLALFGSLTCLQVYAWVHAASGNRRWALYSMAAYAFLAVMGSLEYYRWGGLPNLMGMYLLAGCLTLLAQADAGERRWWALPPMYVAIALSNHHVLMTAMGTLLCLLAWYALRPGRRADARRLLLGACVAAAVAAPLFADLLLSRGGGIHDTGLLVPQEEPNSLWSIARGYGAAFFLAVLAGAVLYARAPRAWPLRAEILLPAAAMLALFVLFEHAGRALMVALYRVDVAPFTPSRFVTDLVYPLSAFAGLAFLALERRLARPLLALVVLLFATNAGPYARLFAPVIDADRLAAYRWIEANTRPETLVFDLFVHAPVLSNRAALHTALPSSELVGKAVKRQLMYRLQAGEVDVETSGLPMVLVAYGALPPGAPPATWRHGAVSIVDVNPKLSALLPAAR
jgi:hypothetical protein